MTQKTATYIWVNIGSSNGLLPNNTKPEPVLTCYQWYIVAFTWEFHEKIKVLMNLIPIAIVSAEIALFKNYKHISEGPMS